MLETVARTNQYLSNEGKFFCHFCLRE